MNQTIKILFGIAILFFILVIYLSIVGSLAFGYGLGDLYYIFFISIWTILVGISYIFIWRLDFKKHIFFGFILIILLSSSILYTINLFTFNRGSEFKWDGHILLSSAKNDFQKRMKEDFENELRILDDRIRKNPNDYEAYYNKGLLYRHHGYYSESIKEYESAIQINQQYFNAYMECAYSYSLIDNPTKAFNLYKKAYLIDSSNARVKSVLNNLKSHHQSK